MHVMYFPTPTKLSLTAAVINQLKQCFHYEDHYFDLSENDISLGYFRARGWKQQRPTELKGFQVEGQIFKNRLRLVIRPLPGTGNNKRYIDHALSPVATSKKTPILRH